MKNFMIIIFLCFIFAYSLFAGAPCGEITNCDPNKAYPYVMCNSLNGSITECCMVDPFTTRTDPPSPDIYGPARKASLPICIDFDGSGPDEIYGYVCGDGSSPEHAKCYADIIYKKSDFVSNSNQASFRWNCLCGVQDSPPCSCHIKVSFIDKNNNEFSDPAFNNNAISLFKTNPPGENQLELPDKCKPKCDNIIIYLNNTPDFHGSSFIKDVNGIERTCYRTFYFINEYLDQNLKDTEPQSYNLQDLLTYSLGRILGLGQGDCSGFNNSSIMNGVPQGKRQNLSQDDICMFKRLYCPELTPVIETNDSDLINFRSFPSPVTDIFNLSFNVKNEGEIVSINLFNILGVQVIETINKVYPSGINLEKIDFSSFESGIYIYSISMDNSIFNGRIILIK